MNYGHRHAIDRKQPHVVVLGATWRSFFIGGRFVRITLAIINFGRSVPVRPTVRVTLRGAPRGLLTAPWKSGLD